MQRQRPQDPTPFDAGEALEGAAPWLVFGIIVVLVVLSILAAVLEMAWWR